MTRPVMTLAEFLVGRDDFLHLRVVPSGDGWDIDLRVDGTYTSNADAEDVLAALLAMIETPRRASPWWHRGRGR